MEMDMFFSNLVHGDLSGSLTLQEMIDCDIKDIESHQCESGIKLERDFHLTDSLPFEPLESRSSSPNSKLFSTPWLEVNFGNQSGLDISSDLSNGSHDPASVLVNPNSVMPLNRTTTVTTTTAALKPGSNLKKVVPIFSPDKANTSRPKEVTAPASSSMFVNFANVIPQSSTASAPGFRPLSSIKVEHKPSISKSSQFFNLNDKTGKKIVPIVHKVAIPSMSSGLLQQTFVSSGSLSPNTGSIQKEFIKVMTPSKIFTSAQILNNPKIVSTTSSSSLQSFSKGVIVSTSSAMSNYKVQHASSKGIQKVLPGSQSPLAEANPFPKPAYSYSCLIAMALKNSHNGCLPVSEIYRFMCEHFPYFKTAPSGWKNSVRHNLSLNKCFEKVEVPTGANQRKGCLWAMNPGKLVKMDDEIAKWSRKDLEGIRKAMIHPENLDMLERGEMKFESSGGDSCEESEEEPDSLPESIFPDDGSFPLKSSLTASSLLNGYKVVATNSGNSGAKNGNGQTVGPIIKMETDTTEMESTLPDINLHFIDSLFSDLENDNNSLFLSSDGLLFQPTMYYSNSNSSLSNDSGRIVSTPTV